MTNIVVSCNEPQRLSFVKIPNLVPLRRIYVLFGVKNLDYWFCST